MSSSPLHVVLVPIPANAARPARESIRRQREAAARALDESARLSQLPHQEWRRDAAGVPVFKHDVFWSLSHKPPVAAGVVSRHPVGIDVEVIQPRREGLWDYVASREERERAGVADSLESPPGNWPLFFRFWTAKEAVLKANRVGLSRLDDCRVAAGPFDDHAELTFEGAAFEVVYHARGDIIAAVAAGSPLMGAVRWTWLDDFAPPARVTGR